MNDISNLANKEDLYKKISQRLKRERKSHNFTQEQIAEDIGISSRQTISDWENPNIENSLPSLFKLIELCKIYKCDSGYLLCEYNERTKDISKLAKEFHLNDESLSILRELSSTNDLFARNLINYFIKYCHKLVFSALHMYNIHQLSVEFASGKEDEYRDLIEGCFRKMLKNNNLVALSEDLPLRKHILNDCVQSYIKKKKIYSEKKKEELITIISDKMLYYYELFIPSLQRKYEFEAAETYLSFLHDFFKNVSSMTPIDSSFTDRKKES